ncbi:hypothetical protein ACS0TY_012824 [Phlomoides rotata]
MTREKGKNGKLFSNSLRIISSCIKTVSTDASTVVRSAGASVAASICSSGDDRKEQVLWAGFDKLELGPTDVRRVLLLGYLKGFQVFDVDDASGFSELVSRCSGPVTFLQVLPVPSNCDGDGKYKSSYPILIVVGGDEDEKITLHPNTGQGPKKCGSVEPSIGSFFNPPNAVRFYSMKSSEYIKVIDFRTPVFMVRCSPRVVAVGLEEQQVHCFDTLTLEKKFVIVTYPLPRVGEQGAVVVNKGYGPLAVGSRWLAYSPNHPAMLNSSRVNPTGAASSFSPSTSAGNGTLGKQLAAGILTLGDIGYKKLSKYYPELLSPNGPCSPGWKTGKLAAADPENAGLVCVKDVVSSEVISQFRAHSSPIAALCFDPSGTLLVTASVHGNNINIFRIMPSPTCSGPGCNGWSSTYVHLYKIYRGITTAVIQDICFSHDSRWIAIVSSKATCHVFVLSPFGGDDVFQALHTHTHRQGTPLFLASAPPWWSTSSFTMIQPNYSPPPSCVLSPVCRIKSSDFGLLNSVSNVAASMVGKIWVPSGAVAATFHNSNSSGSVDVHMSATPLENMLVYSASGFVIQHEIQSLVRLGLNENKPASWSAPQLNPQNEELHVKVEPTQWWDVRRRLDNWEREESISQSIFDGQHEREIDTDATTFCPEGFSSVKKKSIKSTLESLERSHWYLSNAEIRTNSRLPLWLMSKLHICIMKPPNEECNLGGEFEIINVPLHEVQLKRKDLLPIFDHSPGAKPGWIGYIPSEGRHSSSDSEVATGNTNEASIICHSNPPSFSSSESSERGTEKTEDLGLFFKEGYCSRPEIDDHRKSTEVLTDEVDADGKEKRNDEGWTGGVFHFSEEG